MAEEVEAQEWKLAPRPGRTGSAGGGKDNEDDAAPSAAERMAKAVAFLTDPSVASAPESARVQFLASKGLSADEIAEALRQAAVKRPKLPTSHLPPRAGSFINSAWRQHVAPAIPWDAIRDALPNSHPAADAAEPAAELAPGSLRLRLAEPMLNDDAAQVQGGVDSVAARTAAGETTRDWARAGTPDLSAIASENASVTIGGIEASLELSREYRTLSESIAQLREEVSSLADNVKATAAAPSPSPGGPRTARQSITPSANDNSVAALKDEITSLRSLIMNRLPGTPRPITPRLASLSSTGSVAPTPAATAAVPAPPSAPSPPSWQTALARATPAPTTTSAAAKAPKPAPAPTPAPAPAPDPTPAPAPPPSAQPPVLADIMLPAPAFEPTCWYHPHPVLFQVDIIRPTAAIRFALYCNDYNTGVRHQRVAVVVDAGAGDSADADASEAKWTTARVIDALAGADDEAAAEVTSFQPTRTAGVADAWLVYHVAAPEAAVAAGKLTLRILVERMGASPNWVLSGVFWTPLGADMAPKPLIPSTSDEDVSFVPIHAIDRDAGDLGVLKYGPWASARADSEPAVGGAGLLLGPMPTLCAAPASVAGASDGAGLNLATVDGEFQVYAWKAAAELGWCANADGEVLGALPRLELPLRAFEPSAWTGTRSNVIRVEVEGRAGGEPGKCLLVTLFLVDYGQTLAGVDLLALVHPKSSGRSVPPLAQQLVDAMPLLPGAKGPDARVHIDTVLLRDGVYVSYQVPANGATLDVHLEGESGWAVSAVLLGESEAADAVEGSKFRPAASVVPSLGMGNWRVSAGALGGLILGGERHQIPPSMRASEGEQVPALRPPAAGGIP
ncbi:uncharacterized protein AMSG_01366 [Thecamonas trahens ATCC 50062]|uniref:Peroxisomal membrane protein PEX14 n=1 Tax=Thecamonas trahens ATCC 50062 TaxID=461836 RepID=A0A0L0DMX3_THETB|nr:hypothetical protein AMSG_01366 [Thecamonas trahens ATCC 50062]KNC53657.1 hypothetical protein AMSG_01366 [Thecamonas trahens ATCC 50062]|eukprot:XP_013761972.1 hypothetical protein AMSG_01366 [Thecamonas trahens ATCC 50062]